MKKVLSGNEAFARAAFEGGVKLVSSYPGTPSTEITENVAQYKEVYCEWATNEKVALEVAIGASLAGKRAMTCMKHVGLNVASDPLMTASYTGVNGGLVIVVADDPNMFSSQNEQDSRHFARFGKIPMLEPADSMEAKEFTKKAFEISEEFCTPVLVRSVTRLSHSKSVCDLYDRGEVQDKGLERDISKWVMVPANARKRHRFVEERMQKLAEYGAELAVETINDTGIGIICAGVVSEYVKDAMPEASMLKLGMVWPLPMNAIKAFSEKVDKLYVVEELDPVIETELLATGLRIEKLERDICGELSPVSVGKLFGKLAPETEATKDELPFRPPSMCPGCSHRGMFYAISKLKLFAAGDIGCYTLGLLPPLSAINSTGCMGASVSMAHGIDRATDGEEAKRSVAVIGDSTFLHTGLPGLASSVFNKGASTVIILDNSITGMTGHQPNPGTGHDIHGNPAPEVNFEELCRAVGVKHVRTVDPFDVDACIEVLKEETAREEMSVIITNRPCIFADKSVIKEPFVILDDKCSGCTACTKLGCPAISWDPEKRLAKIDPSLCTGCGLCPKVCRFDAIVQEVM